MQLGHVDISVPRESLTDDFVARLEPGDEDHLGFVVELDELERLAVACDRLAAEDARFETRYLTGGVADAVDIGPMVFHTFFVRFELPLWFQFEHYAPKG